MHEWDRPGRDSLARLAQTRRAQSQGGGSGDWMSVRVARCGAPVCRRVVGKQTQDGRGPCLRGCKSGAVCARVWKCVDSSQSARHEGGIHGLQSVCIGDTDVGPVTGRPHREVGTPAVAGVTLAPGVDLVLCVSSGQGLAGLRTAAGGQKPDRVKLSPPPPRSGSYLQEVWALSRL